MSNQIQVAHVKQFSANVFHLSQQKGSRLAPYVRNEMQKGKESFYDRIGSTAAVKKTVRHGDTPLVNSAHSRRRVTLVDYEWADLIDDQDRIRMLMNPDSHYAMAAMWALGRSKDDEIISAALGTAYTGEEGDSTQSLGNSQKIGATDGSAESKFNVLTWRRAQELFGTNDVDEDEPRYIALSQAQITSLLGETEVTSSDFNAIKALVQGQVDTFLGMKVIRTQRLNTQSSSLSYSASDGTVGSGALEANGHERCFAWAEQGILLATAMEAKARVSERDDKSYATQVYCSMSIGATRMEEVKVVEILSDL